MSINRQQGAVMLETAYVLPLVLTVIFLIVEVVAFAMNSFVANDVLYELRGDLVNDISSVSNDGIAVGYASCNKDGSVVLIKKTIEDYVTPGVIARIKLSSTNSELNVTGSTSVDLNTDLDLYVITFTGTVPAVVVPDFLTKLFPINVKSIISVNEGCPVSP